MPQRSMQFIHPWTATCSHQRNAHSTFKETSTVMHATKAIPALLPLCAFGLVNVQFYVGMRDQKLVPASEYQLAPAK